MITDDRRSVDRVDVAASERELKLAALVDGRPLLADVVNISRKGMRIELAMAAQRAPGPGAILMESFVGPPDASGYRLGSLTVAEVLPVADGLTALRLTTDDAETRASLWHVMERISQDADLVPGEERRRVTSDPPRIPGRGVYTEAARMERLRWVREQTHTDLAALEDTRLSAERLSGNIENMIGAIEVPIGLAGPLAFHGRHARGLIYAPFATTEGALVASATRGALALTRSGGVTVRALRQQMMRVPLFVLSNLESTLLFARWVRDHVEELREQVGKVSRHADLISVEPTVIGRMVHVSFTYETGDAAGQNMTTACTWFACQWIMHQIQHVEGCTIENFWVEAHLSGDKKVTYRSFVQGRGIRVIAECIIPGEVLTSVLKVTPAEMAAGNAAGLSGAIQSGMIGFNNNIANVIAAMFASTGQDIACVHESSIGQLHIQESGPNLYCSLVLPCLVVGTVGGGTHLPGQRNMLQLMGCDGPGKVGRLAEIIAGYCLALDISTMAAAVSGQFANAHERLGRNRPVRWFTRDDLGPSFFEGALREAYGDPALAVGRVEDVTATLGSSIITELTARKMDKLIALLPLRVQHTRGTTEVIVKVKPLDEEVVLMATTMAGMCGPKLAAAYKKHRHRTGFVGGHIRELAIYQQSDARFRAHSPRAYRVLRDDAREAFVLVLERLHDMAVMDAIDAPWAPEHIEAALTGLGALHAIWLGRERELAAMPWLGPVHTAATMLEMTELWDALAQHSAQEFPELVSERDLEVRRRFLATLGEWYPTLESAAQPRTLVHNDFNPRNVALRQDADAPGGLRLCAYDWELATLGVPQHDLAEFLCFALGPRASREEVDRWVELHRQALETASGRTLDPVAWREGYKLSLRELAINRMAQYMMAHTFRHYSFMERVITTLRRLLAIEGDG